MSSSLRSGFGINVPCLIVPGCLSHRVSVDDEFTAAPAARVRRAPIWVRSGPGAVGSDATVKPRTVWHTEHPSCTKISLPRRGQIELHRAAHRYVDLVRDGQLCLRVVGRPPPAVPDNVDHETSRRCRLRQFAQGGRLGARAVARRTAGTTTARRSARLLTRGASRLSSTAGSVVRLAVRRGIKSTTSATTTRC